MVLGKLVLFQTEVEKSASQDVFGQTLNAKIEVNISSLKLPVPHFIILYMCFFCLSSILINLQVLSL